MHKHKKHDHNPRLILNVKDVEVAQTRSLPPRTFVIATGEARTNATSPRLVRRESPSSPEALQLDFEADDGLLQVITKVTAVFEIEGPHAYNQVTVYAATDSITLQLPPIGAVESLATNYDVTIGDSAFSGIPATLNNGDTITFKNPRSVDVDVKARGLFADSTHKVLAARNGISGSLTVTVAGPNPSTHTIEAPTASFLGTITGQIKIGTGL